MTPESAMEIARHGLWITFLLAGPLLAAALVVGVVVGLFQAATQINEATLSFVPKLGAIALTLLVAGGWMLGMLVDYTRELYQSIPLWIG
ncbi:MAG TPA: flagellar biosynthesis protein FliQ [Candidatus Acidoferrales bacterium]|nr:flagellar biosynthesis protein FliQ [Candidatus Acidoferrales bacterium]